MLRPRGVIRGSDGRWPIPVGNRPIGTYVNPGGTFAYFQSGRFDLPTWGIAAGGGTASFKDPASVAPVYTRDGLKRAGVYPLSGTIDGDNIVGNMWPAPRGYGRAGRVPRYPRSLIIHAEDAVQVGGQTLWTGSPSFLAAMDIQSIPLGLLGVDVFLFAGLSRFITMVPCTFFNVTGGTANLLVSFPRDPNVFNGGDVMIVSVGATNSGYQVDPSLGPSATGYIKFTSTGDPPPPGGTFYNAVGTREIWTMNNVSDVERTYLLDLAARCKTFRWDVGGQSDTPGDGPGVGTADGIFRGLLNGSSFTYASLGGAAPAALAATIVSRAVPFFS